MIDTLSSSALAGGLSWASSIRLYIPLFIAGWFDLLQALHILESPWVIGVTGLLTAIEFLVDKIPSRIQCGTPFIPLSVFRPAPSWQWPRWAIWILPG